MRLREAKELVREVFGEEVVRVGVFEKGGVRALELEFGDGSFSLIPTSYFVGNGDERKALRKELRDIKLWRRVLCGVSGV